MTVRIAKHSGTTADNHHLISEFKVYNCMKI